MSQRTDLAVEIQEEFLKSSNSEDIDKTFKNVNGIEIITIKIKTQKAAQILKKPKGVYITLQHKEILESEYVLDVEDLLVESISSFVNDKKSVLFVGLGNRDITPDRLGPDVAKKIIATRHIDGSLKQIFGYDNLKSVSVIAPGVLGQTGMETVEIVKACFSYVKPELIIAVDALAASDLNRLGTTIQITDTGICPGSGVENKRKELSEKILGVPVLVVGVPTVVDMNDLVSKEKESKKKIMMVTPRNIDFVVKKSAKLIASSVNRALFPEIEKEELQTFCD